MSAIRSLSFGGAMVALIGFFDDLNHVPAKWRFLTHLSAAVLSLSLLPSIPELEIFDRSLNLGLFGYAFLAISLVWFVNLFNFMDGIDGIAGVQTITVSLGAAFILFVQGNVVWLTLLSFFAASVAGFLVWNWPPAKVFMGDACSGFLGFMLGLFAIITSLDSTINLWTWLILCGVFLIDATTTLITRIARGERWYEAHRSHAYQILSRRFQSHKKVTVGVMLVNILWLLPLGYLSAIYPYWALLICIGALLPLLMVAVRVGAGTSRSENPFH
ncbi:MAG: glycosyltransferase family 4 protein, partial [Proteobacteria bacterium]|nr:glycosyltransferase family 4 protein [Pseudomonadota bacterium]